MNYERPERFDSACAYIGLVVGARSPGLSHSSPALFDLDPLSDLVCGFSPAAVEEGQEPERD